MSPEVIPVSQQGGRQQVRSGSVMLAKTPKDRCKTGGTERWESQCGEDTQESEQQPAGRATGEMRERINTFETVFNVDQFLVRLLFSLRKCCVQGHRSASDLFGRLLTLTGPPPALLLFYFQLLGLFFSCGSADTA